MDFIEQLQNGCIVYIDKYSLHRQEIIVFNWDTLIKMLF